MLEERTGLMDAKGLVVLKERLMHRLAMPNGTLSDLKDT